MAGSRTIKTLTALLVAMTVGTISLMMLETAPIRPAAAHLAAMGDVDDLTVRLVSSTTSQIQPLKWSKIVILGATSPTQSVARGSHFIITATPNDRGQQVFSTDLWRMQADGRHTYGTGFDFNAMSIGICLVGDFSRYKPNNTQMEQLVKLVQHLQRRLDINASEVYFPADINPRTNLQGLPSNLLDGYLLKF
jgi:hypothetical protein